MAARGKAAWAVPALFAGGAVVTALGAAHHISNALGHPDAHAVLEATYGMLRTLIAVMFALLTVGRAPARRRARNPAAFAVCAVALGVVALLRSPPPDASAALEVLGEAIAVAACIALAVSVRALGRCFGVLPEARGLVISGPYAVVRHPLYLTETIAFIGLTIAAPVATNAALLVVVLGVQLVRMRFEEQALTEAFPEYESYARTVPALIPSPRALLARGWALAHTLTGRGRPTADPSRP
jgi:protein-S-isoprenylcysteine O-methyltransferase Ste14